MSRALHCWGRYPHAPQTGYVCHWQSDVTARVGDTVRMHGSTLPYGNGRSYGDSCLAFTGHVLHMRRLDRFVQADWINGVVRVEAGVTLAEIIAIALPRGWFLPVTPGTQFVTCGGAIANDVHGKNHHRRGTFGAHVLRFGLMRQGTATLTCSRSEHPELFAATIGGLGLTGVIVWAEIRLIPVRSGQIERTVMRFGELAEFFALSAELDAHHEYSVAWVDCLAKGRRRGRGVFIVGDHAEEGELTAAAPSRWRVPATPPFSMVNELSLRVFNASYWRAHPARRTRNRIGLQPFFYPLDRILHWNRIYGRRGFQQYQCVIPEGTAKDALSELLRVIADSGQGSFLTVLKRCGDLVSPGLLSFPLPGVSLALDFPHSAKLEQQLFPRLDAIVRASGGRLYPAKDAHMSGEDFRRSYPQWEQLEALRDPTLMSRFWKRVTAV